MESPKISIITASYNYQDLIVKAIDSVIAQTYKNWELIIVDDGSSDNSVEVIQEYCNKYDNIYLFQHENNQNKGLKETVKLGVEKSTGEYIAFLESDDYFSENCLAQRVEILNKNPQVGFLFNDIEFFGDEKSIKDFDKYMKSQKNILKNTKFPSNIFMYYLCFNFTPTFSCAIFKAEAIKNCDFNTPYDPWLDWWLYSQVSANFDIYYLDQKLTYWMRHPQSYIGTSKKSIPKDLGYEFKNKIYNVAFQNKILKPKQKIIKFILLNNTLEKVFRGIIKRFLYLFN